MQKLDEQKTGILIVEIESSIRNFLTDVLNKNYRIYVACDEWEIKNCFGHFGQDISLVIADLNIPDVDEKKIIHWLREQNDSLPILIMMNYIDQTNIDRLRLLENLALLQKPFNIDELFDRLHRLLD